MLKVIPLVTSQYAVHYCDWCQMQFSELPAAQFHEQDCRHKPDHMDSDEEHPPIDAKEKSDGGDLSD